ncbi:MAG TPA: DUF4411 family protein [Acidimicrobiales bacterium]|nr:DUF4411 family protein [Acidimicrobiales bacterium]
MAYLLDTDVFIQAKNLHYGFDFCPGFWDWIDDQFAKHDVFSIEKVKDELVAGGDDLATWAKNRLSGFFVAPSTQDLASLRAVSTWANGAGYEPAAVSIFLQAADYYLVAQAHASGHTVVTHEVPSPSIRKLKIPDACIGMGVKCITPFQMLRVEQARFVLGT